MDADGFVVVSRKRTGRSIATDGSGATVGVATAGMERLIEAFHAIAAALVTLAQDAPRRTSEGLAGCLQGMAGSRGRR